MADKPTGTEDGPPPKTTYKLSLLAAASRKPAFDVSMFNLRRPEDSISRAGSNFSFGIPSRPPSTTSAIEPDPRASPFGQSSTGLTNAFDVFGVNSSSRYPPGPEIHYPGPVRYGGMSSYRLLGSRPVSKNTSLLTRTLPPSSAPTASRALLSSTAVTPSNPSSAEPTPPTSPPDTPHDADSRQIASEAVPPSNLTAQTILATLQKLTEPQNVRIQNI